MSSHQHNQHPLGYVDPEGPEPKGKDFTELAGSPDPSAQSRAELFALIVEYGLECSAGGQGYTQTDEAQLLQRIKDELKRWGPRK